MSLRLAKVFTEATKGSETIKVKGGYLGKEFITDKQVKALADLPPLPVMRATLLGVSQPLLPNLCVLWQNLLAHWQQLSKLIQKKREPLPDSTVPVLCWNFIQYLN